MKIALVVLTRLGNKYLREYVEYYKNLGVDKIYFYDNNREGEEDVTDVLLDYMFEDIVEVVPFSDVTGRIQEKAYQDFYDKHGKEYDWICVFDDDEYVNINSGIGLKEFLSKPIFNCRFGVCFPMINFCDSNVIVNDKSTRLDVYKSVKDLNNVWNGSTYKTIIRGGLNVNYIKGEYDYNGSKMVYDCQCHIPCVDGKVIYNIVDCDGNLLDIEGKTFATMFSTNSAFLKHIPTGCIDDYINIKAKRRWPDTEVNHEFGYEYFLLFNNDSEEKRKYYFDHIQK